MTNFVHLHAHTSIGSMQDSMVSVDELFSQAKKFGQTSLAITDHGTMAAVFDARLSSKKYGVKYIPGIEAYFVEDVNAIKPKRNHLVLLAKNEIGYKNLLTLNYLGYLNNQYVSIIGKVFPRIDWKMIEEYNEGIICLTACSSGPLANAMFEYAEDGEWYPEDNFINMLKLSGRLKNIFKDDLYLELQPHGFKKFKHNRKTNEQEYTPLKEPIIIADQDYLNSKLLLISRELNIPMTVGCDIHYLEKEDARSHDMLMAINEKRPVNDKNRNRYGIKEFYMKTRDQVFDYFAEKFNTEIARELCDSTVYVANKCEDSCYIDSNEIRFPKFDATNELDYEDFLKWKLLQKNIDNVQEDNLYMRYKCIVNFKNMYNHLDPDTKKEYKDRIIEEVRVFESKNFSSYMLITSDLICKTKEKGIGVGPGRGSVGGSLVAHLLGIHEVNPIEYGLLFERFLNKEKIAFPDIDTDFSPEGRDWVENYVISRYGRKKVAHVSNLSTMTPKVVIKDVARSLELGGGKSEAFKISNEITDSIPDEAKTFNDALKMSDKFSQFCEKYPEVERYGRKLVGLEKTFSTHAAGIVISDVDLSTYVPLRYDKDGSVSIQYEKERCEKVGLIKMDFLGLEHLKVIRNTIDNAKILDMTCPDTHELTPHDDKGVWDMISGGQTICVFQMGSPHMRNLCKRIKPKNIEDLSLVNALGRPSAEKSREIYIRRRDNKEKVSFKYDCLIEPLKDTLGICVYEEQLAKLAKHVAGWNLNKADGLRKLTKLKGKDPKLASKLQEDFVLDAMNHSGLRKNEAQDIWESIIEPFAGYGFNKAHGIFYSINGYHTAYYKYHYPAAFMAAVLKSEVEKTSSNEEKLKIYKKEAERMNLKIVAPDINKSGEYFTVADRKTIVMGLGAIKGVGIKAVDNIISVRKENSFVSLSDFLYRTNSRLIRKDVIQIMAKAGCFDSFGITRNCVFTFYDTFRKEVNKIMKKECNDKKDSWDVLSKNTDLEIMAKILDNSDDQNSISEWDRKNLLSFEKEALGEYISGGIDEIYNGFFTNKNVLPLARLKKMADNTPVRVEAIIDSIMQSKTKSGKNKGNTYGSCTLVDVNNDSAVMKIWSTKWNISKDKLVVGKPIRALCKVNIWNDTHTLILDKIEATME